jgi:hypothetical protein
MARPRERVGVRVVAVLEPGALGHEPLEAVGDEEVLPAGQVVAPQLVDVEEHGQARRLGRRVGRKGGLTEQEGKEEKDEQTTEGSHAG